MIAVVTTFAVLTVLMLWSLAAGVTRVQRHATELRRVRLRTQLEQLAAERRIQQTTQAAVCRMLQAARDAALRDEQL